MAAISKKLGRAGKGGGAGTGREVLATTLRDIADDIQAISGATTPTNAIVDGLVPDDPTTASTQATGTGATAWRVNVTAGSAVVNGVLKNHAAQADVVVHSGTQLVANGQSCYAWLVEKNVSGTVSTATVKGTAATTGSQTIPTDAAITSALSTSSWVKLGLLLINRTADTTVTQSQSIQGRQFGGVTTIKTTKA